MKQKVTCTGAVFLLAILLSTGCAGGRASKTEGGAPGITAAGGAQTAASKGRADSDQPVERQKVTVILDYVANTNHTGLYVALEQGYYEMEGLDVEIVEPTDGATASLIAAGKGDFGISYQEDVTVALTSVDPLPIKAVAAIIQHNTSGFASYEGKGITSVKEFEGKTYAGWGGPGEAAVLEAVMSSAGADFTKLNMVISDGSGFETLKDRVDIMWFYEAWDSVKTKVNDFPINYLELRQLDDRLDYYTPVIITSDRCIREEPQMVAGFMSATAKGYEFAISNPEESAAILHKFAPDYSLEMLTASQQYLAGKYREDAEAWGVMKDEVWDRYTAFMAEYGVIGKEIPAQDCYTNEFLPR